MKAKFQDVKFDMETGDLAVEQKVEAIAEEDEDGQDEPEGA